METGSGLFLQGTEEEDQVLLPGKFMPQQFEIGDIIKVFIYLDNEGRPIATTQEPFLQRDDFGYLYCSEATKVGAFMDIGIDKELLIPFSNQSRSLEAGDWAVTYMYLDEKTNRLVGTTRFTNILSNEDLKKCMNDKVVQLISENFRTNLATKHNSKPGIQRIYVMFKIDKKGRVKDIVARGPHPEIEKEAIRVIKKIPRLKKPGYQRGKPVIVPFSIPIVFAVSD